MEIKKQFINPGKRVLDTQVKSGCEGSIIVPDVKSDIVRVLQVEAETFLCDKTVEDGRVTLSGKVNVTVLYTPEEGERLCAIKGSFEFCEVIKRSEFESGMKIHAVCDAEKVTYRLINSRKVGIEATVIINVQVFGEESIECIGEITGGEAECLYSNICFNTAGFFREMTFAMEECLSLPDGRPEPLEILKGNAVITQKEYKALTGKVVVKGKGILNVLYLAKTGETEHFEWEMPFTEVVDIPEIAEDALCDITYEVGDLKLSCDENGVNVRFDVTCGIRAEEIGELSALCDCYFTDCDALVEYTDVDVRETVARPRYSVVLKEIISKKEGMPDIAGVYSAVAKPVIESVTPANGKILVCGKVIIYVLYTTDDVRMPVCSMSCEVPFEYTIDCGELSEGCDILLKGECEHIGSIICSGDSVEVRCGISIYGRVVKKKKQRFIKEVKKGDYLCRETGMLVYFAQKGDNIWDVAKKYHIPQKCVRDAMEGKEGINEGMKLIMPLN